MFSTRLGFLGQQIANISTGNGIVTTVGSNTVVTFNANDTLSVIGRTVPMTYLIVGAGGSSNRSSGGGGGGQVTTGTFIAEGTYTITIGQGNSGNGQSSLGTVAIANIGQNGAGFVGGNSQFNSTLYTGGNGFSPIFPGGGGGAGAGQNGFNASNTVHSGTPYGLGGNGGNGYQSNITGTLTYYAGGGGGLSSGEFDGQYSNGGLGGGTGGTGSNGGYPNYIYSSNAANNTGGGTGGGVTETNETTYGGSGVIIITYVTHNH